MDLQSQLVNLIEERKTWEALTSHPAWGKLTATLQEQADELQRNIIYRPLGSHDEIFVQEFRKGQLEGRLSITVTVETILSDLDHEINQLKEQLDGSESRAESPGRHAAP